MDKVLSAGISRRELLGILIRSERKEEYAQADLWGPLPDYDPDALVMRVDGRVVGAGGLRPLGSGVVLLWLAACVDVAPYRFLIVRNLKLLLDEAKQRGLTIVTMGLAEVPRTQALLDHFGFVRRAESGKYITYELK